MVFTVIGSKWENLANRKIFSRTIHAFDCPDIHLYPNPPLFPSARTIFMRQCNKNFVYYWLNSTHFPRVNTIFLDSHPCDPNVFHRFTDDTTLFVSNSYERYIDRWAKNKSNVISLPSAQIAEILEAHKSAEHNKFPDEPQNSEELTSSVNNFENLFEEFGNASDTKMKHFCKLVSDMLPPFLSGSPDSRSSAIDCGHFVAVSEKDGEFLAKFFEQVRRASLEERREIGRQLDQFICSTDDEKMTLVERIAEIIDRH